MIANAPKLKFYNGNTVPILGLGTFKPEKGDMTQIIKDAIDIGYRHFDCAHCYGNEKEIGAAIKAKITEGVVKREDLFITSKLWNTFHSPNLVEPVIKQTLADLGLDYIDLYLIHWPFGFKEGSDLFPLNPDGTFTLSDVDYLNTWKAMEGVLSKGLTKNIGVSNFNSEQITRLLKNATVKPVTNQVECHPYLTQKKLSNFCKEKGILITAYGPLGSPERHFGNVNVPNLLENKKLVELGQKYNKTPAQIFIRYQVDRGHIVIPKSAAKSRIAQNIDVFDFTLSPEDITYIDTFDCNGRIFNFQTASTSPYYPFHIPF
ncbi:PREDICTED: aldose reductase-like [Vollenhovia emeryi]|uniref:aldose reductase-like n=1 Tax=Vollenhovia emeryi TaxID=411798 RepID=UPI0005F482F2|nr:PREDICTED: aldose reductase-like [Vollenhovia emeryi]XP_011871735.1 PREDICTED: aldose reductase-like [Vollenhovia emeryi]XP_011871736.1 PREDICTED: aldose reductase-like [Vollenhovia emeryi]XP_011871738.1 PREDICTED: aldose reductase-like [Vollenhovia emeryi]